MNNKQQRLSSFAYTTEITYQYLQNTFTYCIYVVNLNHNKKMVQDDSQGQLEQFMLMYNHSLYERFIPNSSLMYAEIRLMCAFFQKLPLMCNVIFLFFLFCRYSPIVTRVHLLNDRDGPIQIVFSLTTPISSPMEAGCTVFLLFLVNIKT